MENFFERINHSFYFNKRAVGYEPSMISPHPLNPEIEFYIAFASENFVEDLRIALLSRLLYVPDSFLVEISSHRKYFSRKKTEKFSPILVKGIVSYVEKSSINNNSILTPIDWMEETGIENRDRILLRIPYYQELFVRWMKEFKEYSQLIGTHPTKTF